MTRLWALCSQKSATNLRVAAITELICQHSGSIFCTEWKMVNSSTSRWTPFSLIIRGPVTWHMTQPFLSLAGGSLSTPVTSCSPGFSDPPFHHDIRVSRSQHNSGGTMGPDSPLPPPRMLRPTLSTGDPRSLEPTAQSSSDDQVNVHKWWFLGVGAGKKS